MTRVCWRDAATWRAGGSPALLPELASSAVVALREAVPAAEAEAWARAVVAARAAWTEDFGGEQYAVGRAFYTHLETGRSAEYFDDARESDARVEAALPGFQLRLRAMLAALVGGAVRPRRGFCGAGVHVFPCREKVAREGGVVHFDLEGLTPHQLARRARAVTLVVSLQVPYRGGGLRVWDHAWCGRPEPEAAEAGVPRTVRTEPGDALLFESYRLHQIEPFGGSRDRLTATLHAVEVDERVWDAWF